MATCGITPDEFEYYANSDYTKPYKNDTQDIVFHKLLGVITLILYNKYVLNAVRHSTGSEP